MFGILHSSFSQCILFILFLPRDPIRLCCTAMAVKDMNSEIGGRSAHDSKGSSLFAPRDCKIARQKSQKT